MERLNDTNQLVFDKMTLAMSMAKEIVTSMDFRGHSGRTVQLTGMLAIKMFEHIGHQIPAKPEPEQK